MERSSAEFVSRVRVRCPCFSWPGPGSKSSNPFSRSPALRRMAGDDTDVETRGLQVRLSLLESRVTLLNRTVRGGNNTELNARPSLLEDRFALSETRAASLEHALATALCELNTCRASLWAAYPYRHVAAQRPCAANGGVLVVHDTHGPIPVVHQLVQVGTEPVIPANAQVPAAPSTPPASPANTAARIKNQKVPRPPPDLNAITRELEAALRERAVGEGVDDPGVPEP